MVYSNLKCIALAIMLFMTPSSFGQRQIKYVYDGAGNRIKRMGVVDSIPKYAPSAPLSPSPSLIIAGEKNPNILVSTDVTGTSIQLKIVNEIKNIKGNIGIYTHQGFTILTKMLTERQTNIDINSLRAGIYILRVTLKENSYSWKIIKK